MDRLDNLLLDLSEFPKGEGESHSESWSNGFNAGAHYVRTQLVLALRGDKTEGNDG